VGCDVTAQFIERAVILCESSVLCVDETWFHRQTPERTVPFNAAISTGEREVIEKALSECAGRVGGPKGGAASLGLARQTLEAKIKMLRISKFRFRHLNDSDPRRVLDAPRQPCRAGRQG
jgi:transcriptional regulator of acetoin/glycerol metabolism